MQQEPLFFDGPEDAIAACLQGLNKKDIAARVYPHKSQERAEDRLKAITNPSRREAADMDEIVRIMAVTERYYPLYYMAQAVSHSRPHPIAPDDEKAQLLHTAQEILRNFQNVTKRLEALG